MGGQHAPGEEDPVDGDPGSDRANDVRRREAAMAQLADDLRTRAGIDPLTGLDMRARFEERVSQELKRAARNGHPTAVAAIEVLSEGRSPDGATSALLVRVADDLRAELRDVDSVGRLDGARFAALLPMCDTRVASTAARRVMSRLGRIPSVQPLVVVASTTDTAGWELLQAAELALDRAKAKSPGVRRAG
jgi:GGDEF domain-containing protein